MVHDHATARPVYRPTAVKGTSSPIPPAPPRCPPTLRWRVAYQHCSTHSTLALGGRLRCAGAYKPRLLNPAHSSLATSPPSTNRSRVGIRASTTTRAARVAGLAIRGSRPAAASLCLLREVRSDALVKQRRFPAGIAREHGPLVCIGSRSQSSGPRVGTSLRAFVA